MNSPNSDRLLAAISQLALEFGAEEVLEAARKSARTSQGSSCTILVNEGIHTFPEYLFRGETYIFSRGNMNMNDADLFESELSLLLRLLASFLKTKKWNDIRVIISGHAVLNMYVKLLVYRMTRAETTDWVFDGRGNYFPIQIPLRDLIGRS